MPRIFAYVEEEQSDVYHPQPKQLAAAGGDWIEEVFTPLVHNLNRVNGEDQRVETMVEAVIGEWLDREPAAFRALLATNYRSERVRYLEDLAELLRGPTLCALAVHVPD